MPQNPSPAATRLSTGPSQEPRRRWLGVFKTLILLAALGWVGNMVLEAAEEARAGSLSLRLKPGWLALSGVLVFANYVLLISAWRYIVAGLSGKSIPFPTALRIWFVSNLGALLPGRVWGIIQMSTMSEEAGVNPVSATAASIINAMVNIATGLAVGVVAGMPMFAAKFGDDARWAWILACLAIIGVILLPVLVPWALRIASRFRKDVAGQKVHTRVLAASAAANLLSWGIYGAAFLCLTRGIVDIPSKSVVEHIAANATSYVAGYLSIISPAGLGVREETMQQVMVATGMANPAAAAAVAVVARLWQLIIQVLPALIFLAYRRPLNEKDPAAVAG